MSDFQVLSAVREYLLQEKVAAHVHLAVPPNASYPFVLLELEEMWSRYSLKEAKGKEILARVKYKISVYSQNPGMEEATLLSNKIRRILEGTTLKVIEEEQEKFATIRFLACVAERPGNISNALHLNVIHHFFDTIIRG